MISTPGRKIASDKRVTLVPIQLDPTLFRENLIILDLEGIDIVLGMDWMTRHQVVLDVAT